MSIEQGSPGYSSTDEDFIEETIIQTKLPETQHCEPPTIKKNQCENQVPMEPDEPVKPKPRGRPRGPNYRERKPSQSTEKVISETDDTVVILKNRSKPVKKRVITVYREDIEDQTPIQVDVKAKKGRGRPKSIPLVQQVNESENIVIERMAGPEKEPTARELKKLELQNKLLETEAIAGRKLRLNKSGKVDGRMKGQRTDAQIAATKKMLEAQRVKREIAKQEKAAQNATAIDESVKTMIGALSKHRKAAEPVIEKPPEPPPAPPEPKVDLSIFG